MYGVLRGTELRCSYVAFVHSSYASWSLLLALADHWLEANIGFRLHFADLGLVLQLQLPSETDHWIDLVGWEEAWQAGWHALDGAWKHWMDGWHGTDGVGWLGFYP